MWRPKSDLRTRTDRRKRRPRGPAACASDPRTGNQGCGFCRENFSFNRRSGVCPRIPRVGAATDYRDTPGKRQSRKELATGKLDCLVFARQSFRRPRTPAGDLRRGRRSSDRPIGTRMEESRCLFRQEPAAASPRRRPRTLDIHRARQWNFAFGCGRRRKLHPPVRSHRSQRLGANERERASSQAAERETRRFEDANSRRNSSWPAFPVSSTHAPWAVVWLASAPGACGKAIPLQTLTAALLLALTFVATWKLLVPFPSAVDNRVERLELRFPAKFFL